MSVEKHYCAYKRCRKSFTPKHANGIQKFCSQTCQDLACNKARWEEDKSTGKKVNILTLSNGLEVLDNITWKAVGEHLSIKCTKPIIAITQFRFSRKKFAAA